MISTYYKGDIPVSPLTFSVRNQANGLFDLSGYEVEVVMIDPRNREVDLTGGVLNTVSSRLGTYSFQFPSDRSLFTRTGDYLVQLVARRGDFEQKTSPHVLRIRELGRIDN